MKNIRLFLLVLALVAFIPVFAQLKKANKFYNRLQYSKAIPLYKKVVKKKNPPAQAIINLADCYRLTKNYPEAEAMYAKAVTTDSKQPIVHFYYAEVLKNNNKLEDAKFQYAMYSKLAPGNKTAELKVRSIEDIKILLNRTPQYDVSNVKDLNSEASEFSPSVYKDGLAFVSERSPDLVNFNKYEWNRQPFLNIYYSKEKSGGPNFTSVKEFSKKINSNYHDGPATFSADNTLMFFTRVDAKNKRDKAFVNRAKLYSSKFEKGSWSKPEPFNLNNDAYSVAHPSLSADGQWLFFTSDMPGGFGGKDIYVCKKEGEAWGKALNLGPDVNTEGDEVFPYIKRDGILFFSSTGHSGLGGLDIFSAEKQNEKWLNVNNLGTPVNSPTDDFGIVFKEDNKGYFSSDRAGGQGSDDIYYFASNGNFITLSGKVLLSQNVGDPARNAKILLLREDGSILKISTTDQNGFFKFDNLPSNEKYLVKIDEQDPVFVGKKRAYLTDEKDKIIRVTVFNDKGGKFVFQNLPADPNAFPQIEVDDVTIAGNLLAGENPSKPLANTKVNLVDEKGQIIQTATTNAFGAFVFTDLPRGENFLVKVDASDVPLAADSKIIITNKSGKELQTTKAGTKGEFKFSFLASDKISLNLMTVEDAELRFDMKGKILAADKNPIVNSEIKLLNEKGEVVQTGRTDAAGNFLFANLPADQNYMVAIDEADTQFKGMEKLLLTDPKGNLIRELKLTKEGKQRFSLLPVEYTQMGSMYVDDPWLQALALKTNASNATDSLTIIENIYYNYGDFKILPEGKNILDKVIQVMKADSKVFIELSSHTDSRSSDEYNLTLSQKRAKAAVDYIVGSGVRSKRISGKGFGEKQIINKCKNGVECSEEEHAKNRRTEFKIIRQK